MITTSTMSTQMTPDERAAITPTHPSNMSTDKATKQAKWRWIEGYRCGCSATADWKKDLPGYCAKHGDSRREVFKLPPKPIEHEH